MDDKELIGLMKNGMLTDEERCRIGRVVDARIYEANVELYGAEQADRLREARMNSLGSLWQDITFAACKAWMMAAGRMDWR